MNACKNIRSKFFITLLLLSSAFTRAQVTAVGDIGITVSDMERSVKFYSEVLGFEKVSDAEYSGADYEKLEGLFGLNMRVVQMKLGDEHIALTDYFTSGGRPILLDSRANDLWFQHIAIVVSDMEKAFAVLRSHHVEFVSAAPQTLPATIAAAAGIKAFYFHDPDNHNLEIIYFPPGKGNPKWQVTGDKIFLGIDHTAIAVSNTGNSLECYRDILGLHVKGESFNYGIEQSRLNNVEHDSLHITGLGAREGPGVEFLEYLMPGPGRPYPADTRTDDLVCWQIMLYTDNSADLYNKLKARGYTMVSRGLVTFSESNSPHEQGFVVRDPDGHALFIVQHEGVVQSLH